MAGDHAAQEKDVWIPAQRHGIAPEHEATMVLPVYATLTPTAEAPAAPAKPAAVPQNRRGRAHDPDALPSDERNMLIFVSALLAVGTLAILAMATIGR